MHNQPGPAAQQNEQQTRTPAVVAALIEAANEIERLGGDAGRFHRVAHEAPDLLEALKGLEEAYCRAGSPLSNAERHQDRLRLIAARTAIAKAGAAA